MGFTPEQVNRMSAWEYSACCTGFGDGSDKGNGEPGDIEDHRLREMGIKGF